MELYYIPTSHCSSRPTRGSGSPSSRSCRPPRQTSLAHSCKRLRLFNLMVLRSGLPALTDTCTRVSKRSRMAEVFLDTAYAIALSSPADQFHRRAIELAAQLEADAVCIVTTQAVLLEIGNALSRLRYRTAAVQLLESVEADPTVDIVPLTETLFTQAFSLFRARPDKEWGLIDCVSFVVMDQRGIVDALTTDEHFQQMGLRALLRE